MLDAPVGDHWAIGLVERMIQTTKRRLSCMKAENEETFSNSNAIKLINFRPPVNKRENYKDNTV